MSTKQRLITAAEALFAEHGIQAVSLRELTRAAGARNATALQYHFGDRDGLVGALLDKHAGETDARRHAMLDAYQANGQADLRALAAALVLPLAAKLDDPDGGRNYLRILAELITRPGLRVRVDDYDEERNSLLRWRTMVEPLLDADAIRFHRRFVALRFAILELARRAQDVPSDHGLFASHLVDLVTALLSAPLSPQSHRMGRRVERQAVEREHSHGTGGARVAQ